MKNHHAVLHYVADPKTFTTPAADAEVYVEVFERLKMGIGDVRELIERASRMPEGGAAIQKIVVVLETITVEAQQALLKIVEEPPKTTHFVFVVPTGIQLLPTLLSRFSVVAVKEQLQAMEEFTAFQEDSIKVRMEKIDKANKSKDTAWQSAIKSGLIAYLHRDRQAYTKEQLISLEYVAKTLLTRGASNKFLLEELALTL